MSDPGVRNLALLEASASTARVLNLRQTGLQHAGDAELAERPFFQSPALNRSLIVKHHLRRNEIGEFAESRSTATKVLLPIDHQNLRAGAKYFFVGQRDYEGMLERDLGIGGADNPDLRLLRFLDEIPSFDPFLLREQLRRRRIEPAQCYFNVSPADTARMLSFARAEIQPLVDIAFGQSTGAGEALARKLLANVGDSALEPLRHVLHLDAEQFAEGVFCWKAFLYYKWRLTELSPEISRVATELGSIRPLRRGDHDVQEYIAAARVNVHAAVTAACRHVSETLRLYDLAYNRLIREGDGVGFRDFLLKAPAWFTQLGEELAAVDHMISFWRYRFAANQARLVTSDELASIFHDFEVGLRIQKPAAKLARGAA